jgi:ubiquinone/menaquinone biosynthesis C-methylase UbiE
MSNKPASPSRWKIAQASEMEYWKEYTQDTFLKEEVERHKKKAEILENEWENWIDFTPRTRILQVGSGPEDVAMHFKTGEKYAIDPLAEFYKKKFKLDYKNVKFIQARGEEIPFKDKFFDVVILANVLDHVESPQKVLLEIKRVLKDKGAFYFEDVFYQKNFLRIAKPWGKIKKIFTGKIFNIHHPYMFQLKDLKNILSKYFLITHEEVGREICYYNNMKELKKIKRADKNFKTRTMAIFGLYGTINYLAYCKKK